MKTIIMPDKFIPQGKAPVLNENNESIGYIYYHSLSFKGKLEIKDNNDQLISSGSAKILTFKPQWNIYDKEGSSIGLIRKKFSFFKKKYYYMNNKNEKYNIEGNIWSRKFKITNTSGDVVLNITTSSSIISLKPSQFLIEFDEKVFDTWEAVHIVQGVRSLINREDDAD